MKQGDAFTTLSAHGLPHGSLQVGDTLTVAGVYVTRLNPGRKWWQVWKPRFVATPDLQTFQVKAVSASVISLDHKQWQREENARLSEW